MNLKVDLSCSYCSKIYKSPISLPCGDTICEEHLKEANVRKTNSIKCSVCQETFEIKENEMIRSNTAMQKLINNERFLSDEEKTLENSLKESLQNFFNLNEQLQKTKNSFDLDTHNHFVEMRRKIDVHREELKNKIDTISLTMIDQVKAIEASYANSLNGFRVEEINMDLERHNLSEIFRDVNLSIDSLKQLQVKRDESISEIQFMLNEIEQVKTLLLNSNDFKPNPFFDQNSFGLLDLKGFFLNPFESKILDKIQAENLVNLCEFSSNDKFSLLYRASNDGFNVEAFHTKCDDKYPTLTILKAQGSDNIFGGYTEATWNVSDSYKSDANAFIFSLTNKDNQSLKMRTNEVEASIGCWPGCGPIFGRDDIRLVDNSNATNESCSYLGRIYKHAEYVEGSDQAQNFLAGSFQFQLDEIEVYKKE